MSEAPCSTPIQTLEPGWFDYNGHLNMAYYNVLFDRAVDHFFDDLGCGQAYRESENHSFFTAEAHVCYVRELNAGSKVHATIRLVDEDTEEEKVYQIVGDQEADVKKGRISISSPISRALIGKTIGDSVEVVAPGGSKAYEILEIKWA